MNTGCGQTYTRPRDEGPEPYLCTGHENGQHLMVKESTGEIIWDNILPYCSGGRYGFIISRVQA